MRAPGKQREGVRPLSVLIRLGDSADNGSDVYLPKTAGSTRVKRVSEKVEDWKAITPDTLVIPVEHVRVMFEEEVWKCSQITEKLCFADLHPEDRYVDLSPYKSEFPVYLKIIGTIAARQFQRDHQQGTPPAIFHAFLQAYAAGIRSETYRLFKDVLQIGMAHSGSLKEGPVEWAKAHLGILLGAQTQPVRTWIKSVCDRQRPFDGAEDFDEFIFWKDWRAPKLIYMQPSGNLPYDAAAVWTREDEARTEQLLSGLSKRFTQFLGFDLDKLAGNAHVALAKTAGNIMENGPNNPAEESDDRKFARLAIEEARKSVPEADGKTHPRVGAVVVKNRQVLATAHRGEAEGNHAEYFALEKKLADAVVAGATVYTTLEPCTTRNHPKIPCVERLVERKVGRVVIGMLDPDPRIRGLGQRKLRSANIITDLFPHDLMAEVEELNREFTRAFESSSKIPKSPRHALEPPGEGTFHKITIERLSRHRASVSKKLEDMKESGLVEIACRPLQPVDMPVPSLEKFIYRSRFQFSEAMRHFPTVEVFQNGVSVGYFPRGLKSTVRFTLYKDGFVAFDALVDFFGRGNKGLHAGWLSYELQRQLQFVKDLLKDSGR